ncbi:MAG: hypothetical protein ACRCYY_19225, partial [Trueperaceae bacterium]
TAWLKPGEHWLATAVLGLSEPNLSDPSEVTTKWSSSPLLTRDETIWRITFGDQELFIDPKDFTL